MKPTDKLHESMSSMETDINDLQGELHVAKAPLKSPFQPAWLLIAVVTAVVIGAGTFLLTARYLKVDINTDALRQSCVSRNENLKVVNSKFDQLGVLFDYSIANPRPDTPPPSAEVLALYREFRKPIPLLNCADETGEKDRK